MTDSQLKWQKLANDMLNYSGTVQYNNAGGLNFEIDGKRYNVSSCDEDHTVEYQVKVFINGPGQDITQYLYDGNQVTMRKIYDRMHAILETTRKQAVRQNIEKFIFGD